jgi:UDP-MurNAc hydroxylase|tara:strand:+ start:299 stop:1630 length:1332 start_codon:yes stop_codon:yes gene_type:complete
MKITHIASAAVLVTHKNTKILTDPWLIGEEYYGSWTHYPSVDIDFKQFDDVDYIYISHIHPDHMSKETLEKINPDIPVLIHNYDAKFVKMNLERWGRKVIELNHGEKFHCGDGLNINIYAADDCDPEVCYKFFGCGKMESKFGSTGIDTMAIIENGDKTILNVNDCPYLLSKKVLDKVLKNHPVIDMLWVGYAGAGSYPQCWDYSDKEKLEVYGIKKKNHFLKMGLDYINKIKPKTYMPFAGTYTLRGKAAFLEKFRVVPELQDALSYYQDNYKGKGILLNSFEWYDLNKDISSKKYIPIDYNKKIKYVEEVLSKHKYEYEYDKEPTLTQFLELLPQAYQRYNDKRKEINFKSDTNIYIYLPKNKMCKISCKGEGFEIIDIKDFNDKNYITYEVNFKLLYRILKGPKYAHWNNAEIGSHIMFSRRPEIYERGLYFSMNYFHTI